MVLDSAGLRLHCFCCSCASLPAQVVHSSFLLLFRSSSASIVIHFSALAAPQLSWRCDDQTHEKLHRTQETNKAVESLSKTDRQQGLPGKHRRKMNMRHQHPFPATLRLIQSSEAQEAAPNVAAPKLNLSSSFVRNFPEEKVTASPALDGII